MQKTIQNLNILKHIQAPMFKSVKHSKQADAELLYATITDGGELRIEI